MRKRANTVAMQKILEINYLRLCLLNEAQLRIPGCFKISTSPLYFILLSSVEPIFTVLEMYWLCERRKLPVLKKKKSWPKTNFFILTEWFCNLFKWRLGKNCLSNQQMQTNKLNTNLQQKLLHKKRLLMFCCIYSFNIANQGELPLGRKHIILHL